MSSTIARAQTGTVATGATITGIDENLVVGAKHRKGHFVDGTGGEIAGGIFNGTMSRFIVFNTALTQSEISSVIIGFWSRVPSRAPFRRTSYQKSVMSSGANPTVPYNVSWAQGTCPSGSTYNVTITSGGNSTVVHSTALSARINLAVGPAYTIAVDCGLGGSSTTNVTSTGYQEGAASYTGTWQRTSFSGAWGGAARYTERLIGVRDVSMLVVPGARLGDRRGLDAWFGQGVRRRRAEGDDQHSIVGAAEPRSRLQVRVGDNRRPYVEDRERRNQRASANQRRRLPDPQVAAFYRNARPLAPMCPLRLLGTPNHPVAPSLPVPGASENANRVSNQGTPGEPCTPNECAWFSRRSLGYTLTS